MSQDTLSDVLRTVRLRSSLFYDVSCAGKWMADAPGSGDVAAMVMPEVDQVIDFHVVTRGECWIAVQGEPPLRLRTGDIVILPQGDAHVVSSAPGMRASERVDWIEQMKMHNRPFRIAQHGSAMPAPQSYGGEPGRTTKSTPRWSAVSSAATSGRSIPCSPPCRACCTCRPAPATAGARSSRSWPHPNP